MTRHADERWHDVDSGDVSVVVDVFGLPRRELVSTMDVMGQPRLLGRYLLVERLAGGGMGEVWIARQQTGFTGVERLCVVKTVLPHLWENQTASTRFLDEARTSLLLQHPNLCTTFDVDVDDGVLLIAMEYIAGFDLRDLTLRLQHEPQGVTAADVVAIGVAVLEGLDHAHDLKDPRTGQPLQLVHRDVSPHNVMLSLSGDVKIIDFGVARSRIQTTKTHPDALVGKLRYMAPEQLSGARRLDRRADLPAVAMLMCELFANARYYGDVDDQRVLFHLMTADGFVSATLRAVPPAIRPVLERAVHRDPRQRFGTAGAFAQALLAAAGRTPPKDTVRCLVKRLWPDADGEQQTLLQALWAADAADAAPLSSPGMRAPFARSPSGSAPPGSAPPGSAPPGSAPRGSAPRAPQLALPPTLPSRPRPRPRPSSVDLEATPDGPGPRAVVDSFVDDTVRLGVLDDATERMAAARILSEHHGSGADDDDGDDGPATDRTLRVDPTRSQGLARALQADDDNADDDNANDDNADDDDDDDATVRMLPPPGAHPNDAPSGVTLRPVTRWSTPPPRTEPTRTPPAPPTPPKPAKP